MTSALHASCTSDPEGTVAEGTVATGSADVDAGDDGPAQRVPAEASVRTPFDSMDSPDDRAAGMSYGDGYGAAGAADAGE
jgi:hypothetical protein